MQTEDVDQVQTRRKRANLLAQTANRSAVDSLVSRRIALDQVDVGGNGTSGQQVVTSDHDDTDASLVSRANGTGYLLALRVNGGHQTGKDQVGLELVGLGGVSRGGVLRVHLISMTVATANMSA